MEVRVKFFYIFLILSFLTLVSRLFYWQVVRGKSLADLARLQYRGGIELNAPRGDILASDNSWLVAGNTAWLLYASPKELEGDVEKISQNLAEILVDKDEDDREDVLLSETLRIMGLLSKKQSVWVPVKRKVGRNTKTEIESLNIKGLGFQEEETRTYPEGSIAAHLLGFVGKDENGKDKGYFGLEGYYDLVLTGNSGYQNREADPRGVPILFSGNLNYTPAVGGVNLVTSIDKTIQLTSETYLKKGIESYQASGGSVVVMDPKTGNILAMASYPSFDPMTYSEYGDSFFKNPIISSTYEPGSIMKVIVMASALDAGVISSDTKCPECDGPFKVGKYYIGTWNDKYNPNATMTDVIVKSDNVGMTYVGNLLGKDRMYDYLSKFGIGRNTGIDLQGESSVSIREKGTWNDIDLATSSFGQGVAVTPIQMIRAVSAIANLGVLPVPKVVSKLSSGDWNEDVKPNFEGRVISEKAAREITAMMVEAAKSGESKWTYLRGFRIAGKTGTAQIPIEGHYDPDQTIASYIGFAPHDDPKFAMLVTLIKPQSSPWASETAAPLWYKIAKDIFDYYGIQPDLRSNE